MAVELRVCVFETPIGPAVLGMDAQDRVAHLDFAVTRSVDAVLARWKTEVTRDETAGAEARRQILEYFAGTRRTFELPLVTGGTPFQREVWAELLRIPYGETIHYGKLAERIGRPLASRAVGAANGANPISLIVPCHRVIGANGKLTGYGGGIPVKEALLRLERGDTLQF